MTTKAQSRGASKKSTPKAHAETPVTEGIHRAAERVGAVPSASAVSVNSSRAEVEAREAKRKELGSRTLTLTVAEACEIVGRDLHPINFHDEVFDVIARDLDVLSDLGAESEFDGWCAFQNLCDRIRLAGKIAAVIGGAP